ncbi:hypothetical protein O181_045232 [Austropuccinia psidii MF-1]|uniref:Uncharacterized protein n=1 Tax=Austropuccinia psidii MF-1 TaxID=1389203 RepID=A0A9Q3DTG0_9BASI|nr:hypothetical protein [Austropuccinia psidii MF-1]
MDGEEVEMIDPFFGQSSRYSPTSTLSKKYHCHLIPSTSRNLWPFLSSVPPPSPKSSTSRPILASPMKPSPTSQPRPSPVLTSHHLQPVARSSQGGEDLSPLPFPASQVLHHWENWSLMVTREDPTVVNEGQDSVSKLLIRVDRNSREVILYANDRMFLGTTSEETVSKFSLYEDELIN